MVGTRVASSSNSGSNKSERDTDRLSKDASLHQNKSLCDRAYEALRVDNPNLVAEYERLLEKETQAMGMSFAPRLF
jgi:hypothetical protein